MTALEEVKAALRPVRDTAHLAGRTSADCPVFLAHPFETLDVASYEREALAALQTAFPDLERRVTIEMAGYDAGQQLWVGMCGYWCGTFAEPFLGIPPTHRMAAMRFHDFYQIDEDGQIIEVQSLWDIPELMMQAGAWPLSPSLGREWHVPGPSTQDGLTITGGYNQTTHNTVFNMLLNLGNDPAGTPRETMIQFWHEHCSWYGPAGIGTCRGVDGFRKHHQAPFLGAMPNRKAFMDKGHFFVEGDYVGFTAWPGMSMQISGGTWLGIPPSGRTMTMRSLDFWRVEDGRIKENWVLVDMLDVYNQLGVDVLARMREITT